MNPYFQKNSGPSSSKADGATVVQPVQTAAQVVSHPSFSKADRVAVVQAAQTITSVDSKVSSSKADGENEAFSRPKYFERIREGAANRWDQLEKDPELAGPWHQLFKQVQSPRHIFSELLQNADDANATEASVNIENGIFIFEHNGEDFTEEHFASLCRFGYSNKRALHTIGFRGIGFKSTFSLGDRVELSTPTLSIAFSRGRFTEPIWIDAPLRKDGRTRVRVEIRDQHRQREVEKNLQEWVNSPVSLLFFNHIRYIQIQNHEVRWQSLGAGPAANTELVKLAGKNVQPFLLARSSFEVFPEEALSEIKDERMLTVGEDTDFPPCQVAIVLGAKGRLFVVLPTGVETTLPFACNGPFIQDPARVKIKDPETSPTNCWLLERVGKLATSLMLQWLENDCIDLAERSKAYSVLTDMEWNYSSLEGVCASIVKEAFNAIFEDKDCLLTHEGVLTPAHKSIIIPRQILDIWPADQVSILMDEANRPAFSFDVSSADRKKLVRWGIIEEITRDIFFSILQSGHLPKPESWEQLLNLWVYVAPDIIKYNRFIDKSKMCIVPVLGKEVLYSANEVVRLGERKSLQSNEDWQFLETHVSVLNQNWLKFLSDQRRSAILSEDERLKERIEIANAILHSIDLESSSDVSEVIEQVAAGFFRQGKLALSDCIRLTQIAAKLGVTVRAAFRYVTQDNHIRSTENIILFDEDGTLEYLLPGDWGRSHLLHAGYSTFTSCTKEEWLRWVSSGSSGLQTFAPLMEKKVHICGRQRIEHEIRSRGYKGDIWFHYKIDNFIIENWDFEEVNWNHWRSLVRDDDKLWGRLVECILAQQNVFWSKAKCAKVFQRASSRSTKQIIDDYLVPDWILKLRDLPCLRDTRGFYRKPTDLFRRTPETEPFIDAESFIDYKLDNEYNRELLDLLGVCNTPTGPDRILERLSALSKAENPHIDEVEKWYRSLDLIVDNCSTVDLLKIMQAFNGEKIILTEEGYWARAADVFLFSNEEDVPGVATISNSLKSLTLWNKIKIKERPTADLAIKWLKELPVGEVLAQEDVRRVRALLTRHSVRIWNECGHWLNIAREWVPTDTISYALTMQSLVPWSHLHEWVKQKTADLSLPVAITQAPPFSEIPTLASCIEERFHRSPSFAGHPKEKTWLKRLGLELCRIILEDEENTNRIRVLAADLADTKWQVARELEVIPYIDSTPAGTSRRSDVLWRDRILYVNDLPDAKLARLVPDKLGKAFNYPDISAALNYCFGRSPEDITEYFEQNFKLMDRKKSVAPVPENSVPVNNNVSLKEQDLQDKQNVASNSDNLLKHANEPEKEETEIIREEFHEDEKTKDEIKQDEQKTDFIKEPEAIPEIIVMPSRECHLSKPAKSNIMERFARRQGYKKDGENRFYHADGSWIGKVNEIFSWEKRSSSGNLICSYWPKDHCLQHEPLQLEAEIWGLIDKFPDIHSLILSNPEEEPIEIPGGRLLIMRKEGKITLYPATYRIVYEHSR